MGIIRGGVLGGFRNKAGAVVGSYWRTLDVIKGLPRISGKAPTQSQIDQRAKFKLVASYFAWIADLISVGYKALSKIDTPMNVAVSYHLREAIVGIAPNFSLDYTKVMFSQGRLKLPYSNGVTSNVVAEIDFAWSTEVEKKTTYKLGNDMLSILVYNPTRFEFVTLHSVVERSAGTYTLSLPAEFSGDAVHCYIAFNSLSRKDFASISKHVGLVTVL
ncbi:DUF6266 family protein [Pedobacter sp. JCM 36344]|uniref:DUF6266 family protein n=1 Tax=Pedobacter sp. JCM 36344 TaxID=3374280 RepID=UPI00397D9E3C